jgi:predicted transcriptional regulator
MADDRWIVVPNWDATQRYDVPVDRVLDARLVQLADASGRPVEVEIALAIREWLAMTPMARAESEFSEITDGLAEA